MDVLRTRNHRSRRLPEGIAGASLSLLAAAAFGADQDRLLPTAQASRIGVTVAQDGRAVNITLVNNSDMVLTSAKLVCKETLSPPPRPADCPHDVIFGFDPSKVMDEVASGSKRGKKPPSSASSVSYTDWRCVGQNYYETKVVLSQDFAGKVTPGKTVGVYGEVPEQAHAQQCALTDSRGREKSWLDF